MLITFVDLDRCVFGDCLVVVAWVVLWMFGCVLIVLYLFASFVLYTLNCVFALRGLFVCVLVCLVIGLL